MRRRRPIAAVAFAATATSSPAVAHAFLQTASPKAGSQVSLPPKEVRITYTEGVEPAFSTISVKGPPGFGGAGPARLVGDARTLAAPLRAPEPPGVYVVRWRVVATDSHVTQGTFRFTLIP